MFAHNFQQGVGRNGGDAKSTAGTNDFGLNCGTMCCCTACVEECHGLVLVLNQAGYVIAVIPILVLLELIAAADCPQLLRLRLGQPANQVDIMDGHVDELTAGTRCVFQCALDDSDRILRVAANQNDVADVAAVDLFLCNGIGMVVTAHEAQHEDKLRMSFYNLLSLLALLYGLSQRLFAEYVLAGVHSQLNHVNMRVGVGNDGNSFYIRVVAQVCRILINSGYAQFFCNFLCASDVLIADCNQLRTRNAVCDVASVLIAQTTNTNDTDLQLFHVCFLLKSNSFTLYQIRAQCTYLHMHEPSLHTPADLQLPDPAQPLQPASLRSCTHPAA